MRGGMLLLFVVAAQASKIVVYTGFDHILVMESENMTATAYDYRRTRGFSSCDVIPQPPLLTQARLDDWMSEGMIASFSQAAVDFTYLGYELFIETNDITGSYVIRRCRDFRPQLTALPCEALATGTTSLLKIPRKLIYIGNNRVMSLNKYTGDYAVFAFDADVHSGGDPFRQAEGPIFTGTFPIPPTSLTAASFAYAQLPQGDGDVLLVHLPLRAAVVGLRFQGTARTAQQFALTEALRLDVDKGVQLATLGENQFCVYGQSLEYSIHVVAVNGSRGVGPVVAHRTHGGNFRRGHDCTHATATACVLADGCGWCAATKSCHPYDSGRGRFCDSHSCGDVPILDHTTAETYEREVREVEDNPDAIKIEEAEKLLDGKLRLPNADYRNRVGAHANAKAAPIHPNVDSELGQDYTGLEKPNDVIFRDLVSKGVVYQPPSAGQHAAVMDDGYSVDRAADGHYPDSHVVMNAPPTIHNVGTTPFIATTPMGDVAQDASQAGAGTRGLPGPISSQTASQPQEQVADRAQSQTPDSYGTHLKPDVIRKMSSSAGPDAKYAPTNSDGAVVTVETYHPPGMALAGEQRTMNYGKLLDEPGSYVPGERSAKRSSHRTWADVRVTQRNPLVPEEGMNSGVAVDKGELIGNTPDSGGVDGVSPPVYVSAMQRAEDAEANGMPKTIPQLLRVQATGGAGASPRDAMVEARVEP